MSVHARTLLRHNKSRGSVSGPALSSRPPSVCPPHTSVASRRGTESGRDTGGAEPAVTSSGATGTLRHSSCPSPALRDAGDAQVRVVPPSCVQLGAAVSSCEIRPDGDGARASPAGRSSFLVLPGVATTQPDAGLGVDAPGGSTGPRRGKASPAVCGRSASSRRHGNPGCSSRGCPDGHRAVTTAVAPLISPPARYLRLPLKLPVDGHRQAGSRGPRTPDQPATCAPGPGQAGGVTRRPARRPLSISGGTELPPWSGNGGAARAGQKGTRRPHQVQPDV